MNWYYVTKPHDFGRFVHSDVEPELGQGEGEVLGPHKSFSQAKRTALKIARDNAASAQKITKQVRGARKTHYEPN